MLGVIKTVRMENQKGVLFDDIFEVVDVDPDGKKFDKGKAVQCTSNFQHP